MKHLSLLFLLSATLTSCGLIEINGISYSGLSKASKERILKCDKPIDCLSCDGNVYQISAQQLKEHLQKHENVILYQYLSYCSNKDCISPYAAEKISNIFGFDFCIVADSYDYLFLTDDIKAPMLIPDHELYKTQKIGKLNRRFYDELTGVTKEERGYNRFFYFRRGEYVCSYGSLKEAQYVLRKNYDERTSKMLDDFFK